MTWLIRDKHENLRASFRELLAENRGLCFNPVCRNAAGYAGGYADTRGTV